MANIYMYIYIALRDDFDLCKRGELDDITGVLGFLRAVKSTLQIEENGLLFGGVPCSLQVFMSSGTHDRGPHNEFVGNVQHACVRQSNVIASRFLLLILLASSRLDNATIIICVSN